MDSMLVTIAPEPDRVRMLGTVEGRDVLKAVLGPLHGRPARAAATLLRGLAGWQQRPLSVVLCVDDRADSSALGLFEALHDGLIALPAEIGIAAHLRPRGRRRPALPGLGDFRDLRAFACGRAAR